jgi:His/Glu/Gln/Arg/opine family amino acid ABC transporter permease subunit
MSFLIDFFPLLINGLWMTLGIASGALILGLILGIFFTAGELSRSRWLRECTFGFLTILRSVPELFLLFTIYFGGTVVLAWLFGGDFSISPWIAGIVALGLIFGSYAAQVFRGAFASISKGQEEVAQALGFSKITIFRRILLPQIGRYALPGLGNLWLVLLKDSSLIALIGAADLMNAAQLAASHTKQPFLFYMTAAGFYLVITSLSLGILKYLSCRISQGEK